MAKVTYEILDENLNSFPDLEQYSDTDLRLIENFTINKGYDFNKHYIETHFYSLNNVRLFSSYEYNLPTPALTADGELATEVTIDPASIAQEFGFTRSDIKILFHFLNDLFTTSKEKKELYIQDISKDRREVLLYSDKLSTNELINKTEELTKKLNSESYFDEFLLNLGDNDLFIVTNIDTWELNDKYTIALKLYEPLPDNYAIKDSAQLVQKVADSIGVKVKVEIEVEPPQLPKLRGPNFTAQAEEDESIPTQYFNFEDLFSYSNSNSNRELFSLIREKSVDLGIDYSDFSNFIHFSSAEERLKNFRYKLSLLEVYQFDLTTEEALLNSTSSINASGSIEATKKLIEGIINNFDHYERHLYYESGSSSWPKTNSSKPYINAGLPTGDTQWYNGQLVSASNYDVKNYDLLTNFLPEYLADDANNQNGLTFTHMLGHHFDNLWIYTKGLTDKYDTDHRLNAGISKDLVQEAVKSLGVKLYNSIEGSNDLFRYFINDSYDSGSIGETIDNFQSNTRGSVSNKDYEADIYKRIYHNIPFLLKTKGTKRGIKALISCFGIPSGYLSIRQFGGQAYDSTRYVGPDFEDSGTIDTTKIRLTSGSNDGFVLSSERSIFKEKEKKSPDTHRLEIGFSPANAFNQAITGSSGIHSSFNIDDYIGDPRDLNLHDYLTNDATGPGSVSNLKQVAENIIENAIGSSLEKTNLADFVRSLKFYDNILFKMIKDFVPARASLDTGIIIKQHLLERNKIKSPSLSGTNDTYSGSMDTAFVTGSDAGAYNDLQITENLYLSQLEATWPGQLGGYSDLQFRTNFRQDTVQGDFGELVVEGNDYYHPDGTYYNIRQVNTAVNPPRSRMVGSPYGENNTDTDRFYIMFSVQRLRDRFPNLDSDNGGSMNNYHHDHFTVIDYSPDGQNSWVVRANDSANSASFTPLASDVIVATFQTTGSLYGINEERHRYYTSLGGFVRNTPIAATTRIVFQTGSGATLVGLLGLTGSTQQANIISRSFTGNSPGGGSGLPIINFKTSGSGGATAAERAGNLVAAITSSNAFGTNYYSGITASLATTVVENDTVILTQRNAGTINNHPVFINSTAYTNGILNPDYVVQPFTGGEDNFKTYERVNDTTFYSMDHETLSGSVNKLVSDESPKYNGELSGSRILITDGELNRANVFKSIEHPNTLFNITTVDQTVNDLLFPLKVMAASFPAPTEYNTGSVACSAFNAADALDFYHGGTSAVPVNGDILYSDINGSDAITTVEDGDWISFAIQSGNNFVTYTANVSASSAGAGNIGKLYNITACSTLDSTAPTGYNGSWGAPSVTSTNVTAVPASIVGTVENNAQLFATASDESGNKVFHDINSVSGPTSWTMDLSTLDDGEDITLDLRLRDAAGNAGSSAAGIDDGMSQHGIVIPKQVAGPSGYSIAGGFRVAEPLSMDGISGAPTQSMNISAHYRLTFFHDPSFAGTATLTLSGSHAGSQIITDTKTLVSGGNGFNANPGTSSFLVRDDGSFGGDTNYAISNTGSGNNWNQSSTGNTVHGSITLTDAQGNTGPAVSASVLYRPHIFKWFRGNSSFTQYSYDESSQTDQYWTIKSRSSLAFGNVLEAGSGSPWLALTTGDFGNADDILGNSSAAITMTQNTGSNSRQQNITIKRTLDGYTYDFGASLGGGSGARLTVIQSFLSCVDPETEILMKTGNTKLAKDIKVGDVIRSNHELSKELLEDIIIETKIVPDQPKVKVTFEDGSYIICSNKHRLFVDNKDDFIPAQELKEGDILTSKVFKSVEEYERGSVVLLTSEKTHTYISNGILSHNAKTI